MMTRFALAALMLAGCPPASGPDDDDLDGYNSDEDCDDSDPNVNPGVAEVCDNRVDDNCDGAIDDDGQGAGIYYPDADEDSFGDQDNSIRACLAPEGYVDNDDDCNDADAAINPRATDDTCDNVDDNCNGRNDEDATQLTQYADADEDGFGDGEAQTDCVIQEGFVDNADDCDDTDALRYPGADERCNGLDDDCDTTVDEGRLGAGAQCAATTCKAILAEQPDAKDGDYWLMFDEPYAIECVMEGTGTQGWTVFTGEDLRALDLVEFRLVDGVATDWYADWVAQEGAGRFVMEPLRGDSMRTDCEAAVIRAEVALPWDFDAWYGSFETEYYGYDNANPPAGSRLRTCDTGAFRFGNAEHLPKPNKVWPLSSGTTHSVSWTETSFTPDRLMIWELNGYSTSGTPRTGEEFANVGEIRIAVH